MDQTRKTIWGAVIIVSCLAIGAIYVANKNNVGPVDENGYAQPSTHTTNSGNNPTTSQNNGGGTEPATISYVDALKTYASSMMQFNNTCVVTPNYFTVRNGSNIMLDNRGSVDQVVLLDNQPYTVKAYDFKVVTLTTTSALPYVVSVDCGVKQNSGRILLQQ